MPTEDARDVAQDIFIKLLSKLPEFDLDHSQGRFRTWLWGITRNSVIDRARRAKTRRRAEEGWHEQVESWGDSTERGPDAGWYAEHRRNVMNVSMVELKHESHARTWACFDQHVLHQRPAADVARELGVSVNSVYANCSNLRSRIRERCREHIQELGHE